MSRDPLWNTRARFLNLNLQDLAVLPSRIGQLTQLQELRVSFNPLTDLPVEIGRLERLQTLKVHGNRIDRLPPEIGGLSRLRRLDAHANQLTRIPKEIGRLTRLRRLDLSNNSIMELPAEIGALGSLEELNLAGNMLRSLPPGFAGLQNLRRLDLGNNRLTELSSEVGQLANLEELNLRGNRLTNVPCELGKLGYLELLNISNNVIPSLPQEIIQAVERGMTIKFDGNPLHLSMPVLEDRGTSTLVAYLYSLNDAVPQYEAKVLLVGEGNVGKTSLLAALRAAPFVEGRPTTHGIEIHGLELAHPKSDDLVMNVRAWDFGGQEVYRITHQFFFSPRALYMVVWNAREGQEQNEVDGWIRRIRLRVGQQAPTLVVATHCDERRPELDYPQLEQTYPGMLCGQFQVDNRSGTGMETLRDALADGAARLPQMGQLLSPRWIAARDELVSLSSCEPQISFEQFANLCRRHLLEEDEIKPLAELLHDLGLIVYYGDDDGLQDIVVLSPEWLTKAIGYVLEDEDTRRSGGVLEHARLKEIWRIRQGAARYSPRHHPFFLRLMEKFDVSYRIDGDMTRSLVAQLVPHERPGIPWDVDQQSAEDVRSLALTCQLNEPAPGLIAWLTVHHHRSSTGNHWRRGVFLRHEVDAYKSQALIELRSDREVTIEVRAPSPDFFFNVLRDSLEKLLRRRWPGLTYQLLVPCPTQNLGESRCSGSFPLEGLLKYRESGSATHACLQCVAEHDVSRLLTGFDQRSTSLSPVLDQMSDKLDDVTRQITQLEEYATDTADSVRRVLKAVGTEIGDCPRLFTLTYERRKGVMRVLKPNWNCLYLTLWCEHPAHWHPLSEVTYTFDEPRKWLQSIAPYVAFVFRTLKLVVPLAGAIVSVSLSEEELKHRKAEIDLMKTVVDKLPELRDYQQYDRDELDDSAALGPAEGPALRALRVLLYERDQKREFGGLRRVMDASGEFLWVCTDHYGVYDPGLPHIPDVV